MLPALDLPRALLRGRYMRAAAHIEHNGVPIDTEALGRLREHWDGIQDALIARIDQAYGVYEGQTFKRERFAEYLVRRDIAWPLLPTGRLDMKDDTIVPIASFLSGGQRTIFDEAREFQKVQQANFQTVGYDEALQIKQILEDPNCFRGNKMTTVKQLIDGQGFGCGSR